MSLAFETILPNSRDGKSSFPSWVTVFLVSPKTGENSSLQRITIAVHSFNAFIVNLLDHIHYDATNQPLILILNVFANKVLRAKKITIVILQITDWQQSIVNYILLPCMALWIFFETLFSCRDSLFARRNTVIIIDH